MLGLPLAADEKGLDRQGVRQSQQGAVEAAGVVKGNVGHASIHLPLRQGERETAALVRLGFRHQNTAVALRDPAAQRQAQSQAVRGGVLALYVEIAVKQRGQLLRRNAPSLSLINI